MNMVNILFIIKRSKIVIPKEGIKGVKVLALKSNCKY